ncbi:MAG: thioredoxin [Candidatus Bathyarchaeota archaeon]|nr:MAG: thioredoxin [Candidatus Bathyarchaeota archaeon]
MSESIVETNAGNWKRDVLESEELVVVNFWQPQCPHCRALEPVYTELSIEYAGELKFVKLNIAESEENQNLAIKYGIMGTPTLKFFCRGRPVQDIVGGLSIEFMRQGIDFAIKKHQKCWEKSTSISLPYIS